MSNTERSKILDKAKKLEALAIRGVGGEKENAFRMLNAYMAKHNITESELKYHTQNDDTFRGLSKEEIYRQFEEEMNMKGLFILGKGTINIMRNKDKLKQFKGKNNQVEIEWIDNDANFTVKGFVNSVLMFDIQKTKSGAVLYPTHKFGADELDFNSLQEAKDYCKNSVNGYFGHNN